jgi:hypothetical protein
LTLPERTSPTKKTRCRFVSKRNGARVTGVPLTPASRRERLPHARLDVLEAGHCVWEERAPEFEAIVTRWVSGGFRLAAPEETR